MPEIRPSGCRLQSSRTCRDIVHTEMVFMRDGGPQGMVGRRHARAVGEWRTAGSGPKRCMVVFSSAASSAARSMHSLGERWHKTALLATSAVQKVAEFFPWPAVNAGVLSTSAHVSSSVHGEPSQPATNGARCCSRTAAGRGLSDTAIKGNSIDADERERAMPGRHSRGGQSRNTTRVLVEASNY